MKIAVRRTPSTSQNSSGDPSSSLIRLVAETGTTKKRPMASAIESTIVMAHVNPPIGSGSSSPSSASICALAEMARARKPIFSDSARATTPLITGHRRIRLRFAHETSGSDVTSISPPEVPGASGPGFRTATDQVETPRIITPSSTAWPPTGASRLATGRPSGIGELARFGELSCMLTKSGAPSAAPSLKGVRPPSASPAPPCELTLVGRSALSAARGAALEALDPAAGVDQLLLAGIERMALRADLDVQLGLGRARVELVPARAAHVREDVFGVDPSLHRDPV